MSEPLSRSQHSQLLEELAESLDIPPGKYRQAVERYQAVGQWLAAPESPLHPFAPTIYPQGSFRLGTVIRPVRHHKDADYDIDLVCELAVRPDQIGPGQLKNLVGDRLKAHATYRRLLDAEGRRCWTLQYRESDGIGFHLDALPGVGDSPASLAELRGRGVEDALVRTAIAITQKARPPAVYEWVFGGSNPRGYAAWFDAINQDAFRRVSAVEKRLLYERNPMLFASVEDVPDALVRTPLQRAIQLMKRHRDVRFAGHEWEDEKPISIIITTLAARAYRGEATALDALEAIVAGVEGYSTSQLLARDGERWVISNPVNPAENFAERWNDPGSRRAEAFFEWLRWIRQDLALIQDARSADEARSLLNEGFGPRTSAGALAPAAVAVPALADSSHCQRPPWPVRRSYLVRVTGSVRRQHHHQKELWPLSTRPVPKTFWIRFSASTNVPPPYEVKWQVVNTGVEARAAGRDQLRGGFDDGEREFGHIRWESTAYRGTHWIEAFVLKDGVCVAKSGPIHVRVR